MAKITGTNGDDSGARTLNGTDRADEIYGLAGNDSLIGYNGDDVLFGGAGADELFGSAGIDFASYKASSKGVSIDLLDAVGNGGEAQGDRLYSIEGVIGSERTDTLLGGFDRDILRGEGSADVLDGRDGNDLLAGGAGGDLLFGGDGADELRGDAGTDFAVYYDSDAGVTVNLATGRGSGGFAQGDRLFSVEAIWGSNYADQIIGNGGANQIRGATGADIVSGGGGADRFFTGGSYDSGANAPDHILDFSRSQGDKIVIGDAKEDVEGFQKYQFIGNDEFTDIGQLRWYHDQGHTIIEGNTAVKEGGDMVVVLDTLVNLNASDFIFNDIGFGPPILA